MGSNMGSKIDNQVIRKIVEKALTAPSGDNCQPWSFEWDGRSLRIFHFELRARHSMNRKNHASMLAFGTLLETIKIAANGHNLTVEESLDFQSKNSNNEWARLSFKSTGKSTGKVKVSKAGENNPYDPLFDVLSLRSTDRRLFEGGDLNVPVFQEIRALASLQSNVGIHIQGSQRPEFLNYVANSEKYLWKNKNIVKDLTQWLRLTAKEATLADGMSWKNLAVTLADSMMLRLLRCFPGMARVLWSFGLGQKMKSLAKSSIKSSAGLICVTIRNTDEKSFCEAGRLAYRTWLMLNADGYGVQPMSFVSSTIADMLSGAFDQASSEEKEHFQKGLAIIRENFNLKDDEIPVWMFRTGVSTLLPEESRTRRLSVDQVLTETLPVEQHERKNIRIPVSLPGMYLESPLRVTDISLEGLGLVMEDSTWVENEVEKIQVAIGGDRYLDLVVKVAWARDTSPKARQAGFQILQSPPEWQKFIQEKERDANLRERQSEGTWH